MSSQIKFENHSLPEENSVKSKVKLTDLLSRLNEEKKREKQHHSFISSSSFGSNSFWNYCVYLRYFNSKYIYLISFKSDSIISLTRFLKLVFGLHFNSLFAFVASPRNSFISVGLK